MVKYGSEGKRHNVEHDEVLHDGNFLGEENKSSAMPPLPKTEKSMEAYSVTNCMEMLGFVMVSQRPDCSSGIIVCQ